MNGHDFTLEQNTEARMMLAVARRGLAAAINDAENGIGHLSCDDPKIMEQVRAHWRRLYDTYMNADALLSDLESCARHLTDGDKWEPNPIADGMKPMEMAKGCACFIAETPDGGLIIPSEPTPGENTAKRLANTLNALTGDVLLDATGIRLLGTQFLFAYHSRLDRPVDYGVNLTGMRFPDRLDLLDLDPVMYRMLDLNPAGMGHWLPALVKANEGKTFFRIPKTTIAKAPLTLLQLSRVEYESLTAATLDVVDRWAQAAFRLNPDGEYFIKTGTFSSKYDYRNAHVTGPHEVAQIGEYLLYIQSQAVEMAGPLNEPAMYGVSTTNEFVVREYVPDRLGLPTIYMGLPLRCEYRCFIDCDTGELLGIHPYWDPEVMNKRFRDAPDASNPHMRHDAVTYKLREPSLMREYEATKDLVVTHVAGLLPGLDLAGQWSLDIMRDGDDYWLIDMAPAERSTYYEQAVPKGKRRPMMENWIPELGGKH